MAFIRARGTAGIHPILGTKGQRMQMKLSVTDMLADMVYDRQYRIGLQHCRVPHALILLRSCWRGGVRRERRAGRVGAVVGSAQTHRNRSDHRDLLLDRHPIFWIINAWFLISPLRC